MGPFWLLLMGMLFVWLLHNNVLTNLLQAITGAAPAGGILGAVGQGSA